MGNNGLMSFVLAGRVSRSSSSRSISSTFDDENDVGVPQVGQGHVRRNDSCGEFRRSGPSRCEVSPLDDLRAWESQYGL